MSAILVEVAPGELYDKISILEIKSERIKDEGKLKNVRFELEVLSAKRDSEIKSDEKIEQLYNDLKAVNEELWVIEDDIRDCERASDFGEEFIRLARAVYFTNDKRAVLKKEINVYLGSKIVEEKSYAAY